ncbi:Cindoxin reductase [Nosema granulosis]|uniref:Cindoxin reductase n=1 Tax=Nosema granulosis TaxID=83296 RepID=A0A9P6H0B9_9MICR|nr:Cindoxin reductase [Nosema granulosis]
MRVCIIGAGPSGLYTAKFLAQNNHQVTIFEKSNTIGGLYKYAQIPKKLDVFKKILLSDKIKVISNVEINEKNFKEIEADFDAFVLASGGLPIYHKNKDLLEATNVIERIMAGDTSLKLGQNVLIIGMGNVALDLVKLLFGSFELGLSEEIKNTLKQVRNVDVLSRSTILNGKFTNSVMRDVLGMKDVSIKLINSEHNSLSATNPSEIRRLRMFNKLEEELENQTGSRSLSLVFSRQIQDIKRKGSLFTVNFCNGLTKAYDTVISSFGFVSNAIKLDTNKPVFKIGWCTTPRGNVSEAYNQAKLLSIELDQKLNKLR